MPGAIYQNDAIAMQDNNAYGIVKYLDGESIYESTKTIQASPSDGYKFIHWHNEISGDVVDNPLTIEFSDNATYRSVTAYFVQDIIYLLTIDMQPDANGTAKVFGTSMPNCKEVVAYPDA